ncbi:oligosaccharyl transferase stt3 protein [Cystoisospora suis]|uniref:Oligosaccharyl transferase stt3 protein n=1 Tax=Cystoisospora suis TaxID=483139 RepID=A0A2C6KV42_9APIC|nr:oligosaccharyl transferase stt3 protein [Cystoisospora suis]
MYVYHCTWTGSVVYSHPSIVLSATLRDGGRLIQDDFREAYYWIRQNTHPRARIMSWWDYGYQATAMGNRTVFVDNNTWNNTHIATVGLAFSSNEETAYEIMQQLDVDYVFVVFGGLARYQSDDINKFLWIIRITSGVYPMIQQSDYLSRRGMYTVGKEAPRALVDSLMYKLSYNGLGRVTNGFDFARNTEIGQKEIVLKYFEEAYTTENWLVRVYKVKKPEARQQSKGSQHAAPS